MRNTFVAVQTPTLNYVDTLKPDTNIRTTSRFKQAICVTVHSTKKEAWEVVKEWDEIKNNNLKKDKEIKNIGDGSRETLGDSLESIGEVIESFKLTYKPKMTK